jgi:predicted glycoside hydrolase/deacetylase ChbG (UPF0249 family)
MAASAVDRLPEATRKLVVARLVDAHANGAEPDYRGIVAEFSLPFSYSSLFRYDTKQVKPALQRKIAEAQNRQLTQPKQDSGDSAVTEVRTAEVVSRETRQALADDPIYRLWEVQRFRLEGATMKALSDDKLDTYAKLESVLTKNYENTARTMLHPGFVASAQPAQDNRTQIVVVLPSAQAQPRIEAGEVIDVEAE